VDLAGRFASVGAAR
jgi:hypothetical protein